MRSGEWAWPSKGTELSMSRSGLCQGPATVLRRSLNTDREAAISEIESKAFPCSPLFSSEDPSLQKAWPEVVGVRILKPLKFLPRL